MPIHLFSAYLCVNGNGRFVEWLVENSSLDLLAGASVGTKLGHWTAAGFKRFTPGFKRITRSIAHDRDLKSASGNIARSSRRCTKSSPSVAQDGLCSSSSTTSSSASSSSDDGGDSSDYYRPSGQQQPLNGTSKHRYSIRRRGPRSGRRLWKSC